MNCPKCADSTLLTVLSEEAFPLDFCQKCHGIWFDQGETAKHFTLDSDIPNLAAAVKTARNTGLSCPRCQGELQEIKYDDRSDLLLDRCQKCYGLWFDFHETEKLLRLVTEQEDPRTRLKRAMQRLKDRGYQAL
ncbi:MAG: zf-TFIIB domain-containing protein [Acidobacteriota bacterium]